MSCHSWDAGDQTVHQLLEGVPDHEKKNIADGLKSPCKGCGTPVGLKRGCSLGLFSRSVLF